MQLTSHQLQLVQHQSDHALCIAVAGSGKTSTLAHLIKNLLAHGHDCRRMMVMMFNKSAQLDFTGKLQRLCINPQGLPVSLPEVRTYHSTGLRLLKNLENWGLRVAYGRNPLGEKETELLIKDLMFKLAPAGLKDRLKSDTTKYIESIIQFIDSVKSFLTTPEQYFESNDYPNDFRFFIKVYHQFEQWRHQHKRITFTDMLYDTVCLIEKNQEVLPRVTNKMDFIIVDEYQDTSTLQHRLTQILAGERAQVIAVGDPDQTIYEFAGANIDNILNHFEDDFGQRCLVQNLSLPHTFRYGHSIAMAASHLIHHNQARKDVMCLAHEHNHPSEIKISQCLGDDTDVVVQTIRQHLSQEAPEPLAVLVRVWAQAVPIELSLLEQGIDYRNEGPSLFDRPEIDALVAALELSGRQFQFHSPELRQKRLQRLLTLPHIGLKTSLVGQLAANLAQLEEGYGKALSWYASQLPNISEYQQKKLAARGKVWTYLEQADGRDSPARLLTNYLIQTEFRESLKSMSLNDQRTEEQLLAIDGLVAYIKRFRESIGECYQHILALKQKNKERTHYKNKGNMVTLSSSHRAKGLEWPVVLIPGLTARYWPFVREDALTGPSVNDLEAERRLLYVAMTRARKKLHLFTCEGDLEHFDHNWNQDKRAAPSRFLIEMALPQALAYSTYLHDKNDPGLIQAVNRQGITRQNRKYLSAARPELAGEIQKAPSRKEVWRQQRATSHHKSRQHPARQAVLSSVSNNSSDEPWQLHASVRHSIFGPGKVIELNDSNFIIQFDSHQHGIKRFARTGQVRHLFEPVQVVKK